MLEDSPYLLHGLCGITVADVGEDLADRLVQLLRVLDRHRALCKSSGGCNCKALWRGRL